MNHKNEKRIHKALLQLESAVKRLELEQGRTARRNARKATTSALRYVRRVLDETYPNIPLPKRKTAVGKRKKKWTEPEGWKDLKSWVDSGNGRYAVKYQEYLQNVAEAKVPIKDGYVPEWVALLGHSVAKLRRAKKSVTFRKAAVATILLEQMGQSEF